MYWFHCSSEPIFVRCTLPACTTVGHLLQLLFDTIGIRQSANQTPTTCFVGPLCHCARAFLPFISMLQLLFDTLSGCICVFFSFPAVDTCAQTTLSGNV
jgi:hypothetical protein